MGLHGLPKGAGEKGGGLLKKTNTNRKATVSNKTTVDWFVSAGILFYPACRRDGSSLWPLNQHRMVGHFCHCQIASHMPAHFISFI